jgi:hypothetical protein
VTQFETIRKTRHVIKLNGGATVAQIASVARMDSKAVTSALKVMGDAYIDRWDGDRAVWDCIDTPEPCPKPRKQH